MVSAAIVAAARFAHLASTAAPVADPAADPAAVVNECFANGYL
ncbi:hypothetical protein [Canibacter zhuwentaonis]|nr:hypothetical protein [Canibacter zhuwentaonis]